MRHLRKTLFLISCFIVIIGSLNVMAVEFAPGEDVFHIESVAYRDVTWDINGTYRDAEQEGVKITISSRYHTESGTSIAIDKSPARYIKVIPHETRPGYFYLQPQHSRYVATIANGDKTPGAELELSVKGIDNQAQMFKLIEVPDRTNRYYIQNVNSGLYLTAHGKNTILTQERKRNIDSQKWHFGSADWSSIWGPISSYDGKIYAIENVMAEKFIDIPGAAPNQKREGEVLQLWDMDYDPDRYVQLFGNSSTFFIRPLHSNDVWDVKNDGMETGTLIELDKRGKTLTNQHFKFKYAGAPNTYWIEHEASGKYLTASRSDIEENGCKIELGVKGRGDNQKWRLHPYQQWPEIPADQEFYIKSAYTDKYWDIDGEGAETNQEGKKIQMYDLNNEGDRRYKFLPTGDKKWVNIQVQNGGKYVKIEKGLDQAGTSLVLGKAQDGNSQKFLPQPTSPTTFALKTKKWQSVDIRSEVSDVWKKNGAELILYKPHYRANQQFQLIYADGSNKGKPYHFFSSRLEYGISKRGLYFVKSVAYNNLSWDLKGYNLDGKGQGGKIQLWTEDRGADRYIKILPAKQPGYVFFQPQHSNFVADITKGATTPGAELQLWEKGESNQAQMFKMIKVVGEINTYYLQNANSELYLTAHGKGEKITQEAKRDDNSQKWYFEKRSPYEMAQPSTEKIYALENVKAKKVIDIPGIAPNQSREGGELQLWNMDYDPDRYVQLRKTGVEDYFQIQPLHSRKVWDVKKESKANGTPIQLWHRKNIAGQQFKFEYAGEPLTYFIKNRNSGKYVDAFLSDIDKDGCKIETWTKNNLDNQKWRLHPYDKLQMPPEDQEFFIKAAYTDKYWDIGGIGDETKGNGKKLQMWDLGKGGDRRYKFLPTGHGRWINIQIQNDGRHVDLEGGSTKNGTRLHIWDGHDGASQRFALQPTSPTTFSLRTKGWKSVDIRNEASNAWKENGADLILYDTHYGSNQQFQLIYADGPNKGQPYHFFPSKGISNNIVTSYDWTKDWTTAKFYQVGNDTYLFLLKEKGLSSLDKNVHIHKMRNNGSVGNRIASYKWSEGWTTVEPFEVNNKKYLFLLKEGNGIVHINKISSDGTIGGKIAESDWSSGWTSARFYQSGGDTYLFLLKEKGLSSLDKNVHIHKMRNNGSVGNRIASYKWSEGWTTVEPFEVNNKKYLFLLKEGNGIVHINKISSDGTIGGKIAESDWSSGWTSARFYQNGGYTYLFLLKEKGLSSLAKNVHIHKMRSSGFVGNRLGSYRLSEGWTTVESFDVDNSNFIFLIKKSNGVVNILDMLK